MGAPIHIEREYQMAGNSFCYNNNFQLDFVQSLPEKDAYCYCTLCSPDFQDCFDTDIWQNIFKF